MPSATAEHVVVVGAGLGGLSCALYLAGAGRRVTVVEREPIPGGRAGQLALDGHLHDTGPTVLTMPDLIADALAAVGEELGDWLTLTRLAPAYRAFYPDGSTLDVHADVEAMADEITAVCGPREAAGYRRFVAYAARLWRIQRDDFIDRNLDSPRDLLTPNLARLVAAGGLRRLDRKIAQFFRDPRTQRVFSFQAMYAGLAPQQALALYAVIAHLDSIAGVYHPRGGLHAVARALAGAAEKHGVTFRYGTAVARVEAAHGRATAVLTADGDRIPADAVVLNPDLAAAYDLLPGPPLRRRLRYSPSAVVLHLGATAEYQRIAHHNIHFGRAWRRTFAEVISDGTLMSDPSLLVTNPSRTDPTVAPAGRHTYYVLAPVPNLDRAPFAWRSGLGDWYADALIATLEERGYRGLGASVRSRRVVTPDDWAASGLAAGTPFAAAHTLRQTGPFRPGNRHPALPNVVFTGSGTQPGVGVPMVLISGRLAAARLTGNPR
ncbi:phytoene dehydrogenase [Pilimelia anulata]|uniref:Phytoene dehydrogenase n=1 Tax=Pilimelia anulata TaxID=53371 RepID=A0A8J3F9J4_9ACTN|nr:phytoene desaturase family protein [Pilimelia anulata]GGJ93984.1 phytoene dehydrogenase [Pilimelia anulata]